MEEIKSSSGWKSPLHEAVWTQNTALLKHLVGQRIHRGGGAGRKNSIQTRGGPHSPSSGELTRRGHVSIYGQEGPGGTSRYLLNSPIFERSNTNNDSGRSIAQEGPAYSPLEQEERQFTALYVATLKNQVILFFFFLFIFFGILILKKKIYYISTLIV